MTVCVRVERSTAMALRRRLDSWVRTTTLPRKELDDGTILLFYEHISGDELSFAELAKRCGAQAADVIS